MIGHTRFGQVYPTPASATFPMIKSISRANQAEIKSNRVRLDFGLICFRPAVVQRDAQGSENGMAGIGLFWDALKQSKDTSCYETETCAQVEKKLLDYFLQAEDKRFKKKSTIPRWDIVFDIRKIKLINS